MFHRGQLFGRFPAPPGPVGFLDGMQLTRKPQSGCASGTMTQQFGDYVDIPIDPVDLSRAFLLLPAGGVVKCTRPMVGGVLSASSVRLYMQNLDNQTSDYSLYWAVVEAENIRVQRGVLSYSIAAATLATQVVTISKVNLSKTFPVGTGCYKTSPSSGGNYPLTASFGITGETAITMALGNNNADSQGIEVPWQAVELLA